MPPPPNFYSQCMPSLKELPSKDNLKKKTKKPKVILLIFVRSCAGFAHRPFAHPRFTHCLACSVCSSSGVWPRWAVGQYRHVSSLALWSLVEFGQWEGPAGNKKAGEEGSQSVLTPCTSLLLLLFFNGYSFSQGWGPSSCLQLSLPGLISHHFRSLGSNGFLLLHQNSLLINVALECAVSYTFRWIYLQSWVMCIQRCLPKFLN